MNPSTFRTSGNSDFKLNLSSLYGKLVTDTMNYKSELSVSAIRTLVRLADCKLAEAQKISNSLHESTDYDRRYDEKEVKKLLVDLIHEVVDIENLLDTAGSLMKFIEE